MVFVITTNIGVNKYISIQKSKINNEIRSEEVRLISASGEVLGVVALKEALKLAEVDKLDVVEVDPNSSPPVCRLMDYGKHKYKQTKKGREAKKKQHVVKVKEIKLRPRIEEHDYRTKYDKAKLFLLKGNKVKLTLMFRGRELAHVDLGEAIVKRFCKEIVDDKAGAVESNLKRVGRTMVVGLAPVKSK